MSKQLKLYYYPGACSLASHIALEESGLPYEHQYINVTDGSNYAEDYLAVNPYGKVPALVIDGKTLTENQAILSWLADQLPDKHFLPAPGDLLRYRAHELMSFFGNSFHIGIRSIFRSQAFAGDNKGALAAVSEQGLKNLAKCVNFLETQLEGKPWSLGDSFSFVDAYLLIMYLWSNDKRIQRIPDRPNMAAIAKNVWQRPAVKKIIARESEFRPYVIPEGW
jgi:glutathione S-transferase